MIAFDKSGSVLAMSEGGEVLVHDRDSGGPLWRTTLDAPICGLAADATQVVAVTATGAVTWFAARTGSVTKTATLTGGPIVEALVELETKRVVARTGHAIIAVGASGEQTTLADHGASAFAMRPDGTVLAVDAANALVTLALDGTRTVGPVPAMPVRAIAWHPDGFWAIGGGRVIQRWDGSSAPAHITRLPEGSEIDFLACSKRALAVAWNHDEVVTLEWPSRDTLASVTYADRKVEGIDFGPWPWIGIGLDLGDGNMQMLDGTGSLHRTDTHPGRAHHRWVVLTGGSSKPEPAARHGDRTKAPAASARAAGSGPTRLKAILIIIAVLALIVFLATRH